MENYNITYLCDTYVYFSTDIIGDQDNNGHKNMILIVIKVITYFHHPIFVLVLAWTPSLGRIKKKK